MNLYSLILVVTAIGGLGISLWGWRIMQTSRRVAQWPTVTGQIALSELNGSDNDLLPDIRYRYQVDGQSYDSRFEFPSGTHPLPEFNRRYVEKYPRGAEVTVYYNPQQPADSTLEPGAQGDWMILALGILLALGAIGALLISR
jgi:hypothetical protein